MITDRVLLDTGPLVALLSENDQFRESCLNEARQLEGPSFTCLPVITEAAYLLRNSRNGLERLLELCDGTDVRLLQITEDDFAAVNALRRKYADQHFQFADLCLMYLAEREEIEFIFTLDRRHFSVFRKASGAHLRLLPE